MYVKICNVNENVCTHLWFSPIRRHLDFRNSLKQDFSFLSGHTSEAWKQLKWS